jgi:threonine synthase
VVCVLTGHGLKDPETAETDLPGVVETAASADDVRRVLGW